MSLLFLTSNVRIEEKLLLEAMQRAGLSFSQIDVRHKVFDRSKEVGADARLVFNRCIAQTQSLASVRYFESLGIQCLNTSYTISLCGDKQATTLALQAAGLPTPRTIFALGKDSAMQAIKEIGLPVVVKPIVGSWGRMVVRANDLDAAEAILELRENLTGHHHRLHYIQRLVETGNRDIRVIMSDEHVLTAYRRVSDHWVTNAARDATGERMQISASLERLCQATSRVAGGGILSIDLFETADDGFLVNEINHTTEFALAMRVTGQDIAAQIVDRVRGKLT